MKLIKDVPVSVNRASALAISKAALEKKKPNLTVNSLMVHTGLTMTKFKVQNLINMS